MTEDDRPKPEDPAVAPPAEENAPKRAADLLKEAMAAKKAAAGFGKGKLRPDFTNAKAQRDAERRAGKSRKVH